MRPPIPTTPPSPDTALERAIGPWTIGANAVNLTVGAGIFALPATVAAMLGPAALAAYVVCGALILLVLACFAEVGSRVTRSGGVVAYVDEAFGPAAGFVAWAVFAVAFCAASDAALVHVMLDALAVDLPALAAGPTRVAAIVATFALLAAVNVRGVRQGARLAIATTVAKLVPLLLVIALGTALVQLPRLAWPAAPSVSQVGATSLVLFFAFAGAEGALTPGGEIRDPARAVPRGLLGGAGVIVALFVALQLVSQGVLGDELARSPTPLADVAQRAAGGIGRRIVLGCTAVAVFGAIAADVLGTPRSILAVAERGMLPAGLARVHPRFRTPWIAIIAYASLATLLGVSGGFQPLAVLSSLALLLVYLAVCLAALRLRYTRAPVPGAFRTPGGPTVALLASAAVLWLIAHSTWREVIAMAVFVAVAATYHLLRRRSAPLGTSLTPAADQ